jgi:hypothetical protein
MSLRYTLPPVDHRPTGKFQHQHRLGTQAVGDQAHRGWTFQLIQHHTGATVKRTMFNVAVADPKGHRAGYLQGFPSAEHACAAAREWIDERTQ